MALYLSIQWPPRGHCFWSRYTIHLSCMVRLLQLTRGQRQPHLRLPSPIQQPTRMSKPRNHPFPQNILQSEPVWLEYIIVLGRVCTEFFEKTLNQVDPFQYILGYQPPLFPRSGEPTKRSTVYEWLERNKPQSPCTSLTCPEMPERTSWSNLDNGCGFPLEIFIFIFIFICPAIKSQVCRFLLRS